MTEQMIDLIENAGEKNGEQSEIILLIRDDITQAFYGDLESSNQSYSILTMVKTAAENQIAILSQYNFSEIKRIWIDLDNLGQVLSGSEFQDETGWNKGFLNAAGIGEKAAEEKTVIFSLTDFLNSPVPFL